MRVENQFTIFLENKPGRLSNICSALAREKVSIQALTVMDSKEHAVLRLVSDDGSQSRVVLRKLGVPFSETDVFVVELKHQAGALAHLCEALAAEHVNIDYLYSSAAPKSGQTIAVFKATPADKVRNVLAAAPAKPERRVVRRPPVKR